MCRACACACALRRARLSPLSPQNRFFPFKRAAFAGVTLCFFAEVFPSPCFFLWCTCVHCAARVRARVLFPRPVCHAVCVTLCVSRFDRSLDRALSLPRPLSLSLSLSLCRTRSAIGLGAIARCGAPLSRLLATKPFFSCPYRVRCVTTEKRCVVRYFASRGLVKPTFISAERPHRVTLRVALNTSRHRPHDITKFGKFGSTREGQGRGDGLGRGRTGGAGRAATGAWPRPTSGGSRHVRVRGAGSQARRGRGTRGQRSHHDANASCGTGRCAASSSQEGENDVEEAQEDADEAAECGPPPAPSPRTTRPPAAESASARARRGAAAAAWPRTRQSQGCPPCPAARCRSCHTTRTPGRRGPHRP